MGVYVVVSCLVCQGGYIQNMMMDMDMDMDMGMGMNMCMGMGIECRMVRGL